MRSDMNKVIVERPRNWKDPEINADRRRKDFDGPQFLGMRAGYGRPALNENLNPLRRYLHAQVGRPWNKVYGEICANIDKRNTVQLHVLAHLEQMIAVQVEWRDGQWVDIKQRDRFYRGAGLGLSQKLYVDPRTGLIRPNKAWRSYSAGRKERWKAESKEIAARRRQLDDNTLLLRLEGEWYEVRMAAIPAVREKRRVHDGKTRQRYEAERVFDVVLKRPVNARSADCDAQYGREGVYAVSKRQLSRREIESYELPR